MLWPPNHKYVDVSTTVEVTDACGNSTIASATVTVPHDKGK